VRQIFLLAFLGAAATLVSLAATASEDASENTGRQAVAVQQAPPGIAAHELFAPGTECMACHNGLVTSGGQDVSIGSDWQASMMANSARDPYWQAAVRREIMDHPQASAEIQDECSACHMPMSRYAASMEGKMGQVFGHLPFRANASPMNTLAQDGVSCTVCHQIEERNLGTRESFTAGFEIDTNRHPPTRTIYGPFPVTHGRRSVMQSAARFEPRQGMQIRDSGLCGSCHTLYTHTRGEGGETIGTLPEQMPYLEWKHSAFYGEQSCQQCHMPVVGEEMPISSVLGQPREGFRRHVFRGGNFFMLRMLARYRDELSVDASAAALSETARVTEEHLKEASARVTVPSARIEDSRLMAQVAVENLAGHKLPTAYPSRRAWLHLEVQDVLGRTIFESGRFNPDGSISGNANDADPSSFEPHYQTIRLPGEVQIYEGILAAPDGTVTTGLLTAITYTKDNRLLPRGFDKHTADPDIAVHGRAAIDDDFSASGDTVYYDVALGRSNGPYRLVVRLLYQPIAYRWALNLAPYDAFETQRFTRYYRSMAAQSAIVLTSAAITLAR